VRRKADAVRHMLAEGFDPSQKRKAERETLANVREADARSSTRSASANCCVLPKGNFLLT
jgi:hypothetical protein